MKYIISFTYAEAFLINILLMYLEKLLYEQPPTCLAFILLISYPPYDGVDDNKSF